MNGVTLTEFFSKLCPIMNSEFIDDLKDNIKDSYLHGSISNKERMDRIGKYHIKIIETNEDVAIL